MHTIKIVKIKIPIIELTNLKFLYFGQILLSLPGRHRSFSFIFGFLGHLHFLRHGECLLKSGMNSQSPKMSSYCRKHNGQLYIKRVILLKQCKYLYIKIETSYLLNSINLYNLPKILTRTVYLILLIITTEINVDIFGLVIELSMHAIMLMQPNRIPPNLRYIYDDSLYLWCVMKHHNKCITVYSFGINLIRLNIY